jgi:hypothetical protein
MTSVLASAGDMPSVEYKYIMVKTLTDEVLAELPFQNVSYSKGLNEAGQFEGEIPINAATSEFDIYESTVPGYTSLYILRNDECVWGGIVSVRNYNAKDRVLSVSADEFVSYLDRRVLWKTWSTRYPCRIDITDMVVGGTTTRIGKVTIASGGSFKGEEVSPGDQAFISFGSEEDLAELAGTYTVLDNPAPDLENGRFFYFAAFYRPEDKKNFIPIEIQRVDSSEGSVEFKQTTRRYLKNLISNHFNDDTYDLSFASEVIAPGELRRFAIAGYSRTNNIVTITTSSADGPHNLVVGQRIAIRDLSGTGAALNSNKTVVTEIVDKQRFRYQSPASGSDIPGTVPSLPQATISRYQRVSDIVTITTSTNHGLAVGDLVTISDLHPRLNTKVRHVVTRLGTGDEDSDVTKVFQFRSVGPRIGFSVAPANSRVIRIPNVETYTGGTFRGNANIGIEFDDSSFDVLNNTEREYQDPLRGYELLTFKEILDKYSEDNFGFDYRVDCSYNKTTNTFTKNFVFLPLRPKSLTTAIAGLPGGVLPADKLPLVSYFEATNRIFEYPGNILNVNVAETIEEGATRVWVQGSIPEISEDASQPYSGLGDHVFLNRGWPIFDKVIRKDKIGNKRSLFSIARSVLGQAQLPVSTFEIEVNGSLPPSVNEYNPGDWCLVNIDDIYIQKRLNSYYERKDDSDRNVFLRKIAAIQVQVPINPAFPENVILTLVTEPGIDINGEEAEWRWPRGYSTP